MYVLVIKMEYITIVQGIPLYGSCYAGPVPGKPVAATIKQHHTFALFPVRAGLYAITPRPLLPSPTPAAG